MLDGTFVLRPIEPSDAADWLALITRPEVFGPTSWAVTELGVMLAAATRHAATGRRWALVRAEDGAFVGTCGASRAEAAGGEGAGEAEVAYELDPRVWGRGLAGAAVRAYLEECAAAGIPRLVAHTWVRNEPSQRVLERCGFSREELLPAFRSCRGELRDFVRWGRSLDR